MRKSDRTEPNLLFPKHQATGQGQPTDGRGLEPVRVVISFEEQPATGGCNAINRAPTANTCRSGDAQKRRALGDALGNTLGNTRSRLTQSRPVFKSPFLRLPDPHVFFPLQLSPSASIPSSPEPSTKTGRKDLKKAQQAFSSLFPPFFDFCFKEQEPEDSSYLPFELRKVARVPVPFSIFPSTYRDTDSQTQTQTTSEEVEIKLTQKQPAGREGQYSSYSATAELPPRGEQRYSEEEVRITREEERYHRPGFEQEQTFIHEERRPAIAFDTSSLVRRLQFSSPASANARAVSFHQTIVPSVPSSHHSTSLLPPELPCRSCETRFSPPTLAPPLGVRVLHHPPPSCTQQGPQPPSEYTTSHAHVEVDTRRHPYYSTPIDVAEREYRQRFRPNTNFVTVDPPAPARPQFQTSDTFQVNNYTVEGRPSAPQFHSEKTEINNFTVDGRPAPQYHSTEKTEINNFTVDPRSSRPQYNTENTQVNNFTVDARAPRPQYHTENSQDNDYTVDPPASRPYYKKDVKFTEETVETTKFERTQNKDKMGYYDEDGHYHSFRAGVHKLGDKIAHPRGHEHVEVDIQQTGPRGGGGGGDIPNTVTIPCHHIRLGDFLMLQGRPCQVIRISTSSATGQYRYLGVDLFSKQLHEESSFISNPAPSVVVQTMLGPVFKQYRVLDIQDGYVVAMTETGDVKQGLAVIDQSNLYSRLNTAFQSGRGSLRVLVLNDGGRELAVDLKVLHGSSL
ncbi:hypothetical protein G7046_g4797 [Stylonectria norvegica]|nr:hypothetical protein G7046_g4797 [Stylonectria norvegica]